MKSYLSIPLPFYVPLYYFDQFHVPIQKPSLDLALEACNPSSSFESLDDYNKPIALRKGVKFYTKHPIANFVPYHASPLTFHSFYISLSFVFALCSVSEALSYPRWRVAMEEEMSALKKNHT